MDRNDISRTFTAARLGGASPQSVQTHPEWWARPRFINLALGFVFGAANIIALGQSLTRNDKMFGLYCFGIILLFVVIEILLEKYLAGFETKRGWQFGGAAVALLVVMPLAITPKCGWNNDKCHAAHSYRPAQRPAP